MSATQRKTLATEKIVASLGVDDQGKAITAALEIISERLAHDAEIQQSLRQKYDELAALGTTSRKADDLGPLPVPISGGTWADYKPFQRYDPYRLLHDFGGGQLRAVLKRGTQTRLREAVGIIQEREPGAKPSGRTNQDLIEFIMQHVAPGY